MEQFTALKRKALEKYFSRINDQQRKAVFKIKGPLLILAGAGSGKTTVLVNRIANMIYFGNAYNTEQTYGTPSEQDIQFLKDYIDGKTNDASTLADIVAYNCIKPWSILAITFTNKAAGELKERLAGMLGEAGQGITAATFHSACARILRRECDKLGFSSSFTIYDSDDSQRTVKSILRELDISEKMFPPRTILSEISHAKDLLQEPDEYIASAAGDYRNLTIGKVYKHYQKKLKAGNAMDFDDMICHTVKLFEQFPDVLDHYQNLYKYIMVDEYQDTNKAQFRLVSLLSQKFHNLCVVGDDDQSIYKFRGATIENILNFEEQFDCNADTDVIKLEQNYRSTQNILNCANQLISNNQGRKGKNLWTASGDGEKVTVYKASSERSEAKFVADTILEDINKGRKYNDHAILYRMNAQSNALEQTFIQSGIPYKIIGGLKFYDRKEIKDILAYLSVINNHFDFLRLRRIINEPKRGIGEATVNALEQITSDLGDSPIHIMQEADMLAPLVKRSKQLMPVGDMLSELTELSDTLPLAELLDKLLDMTGYKRHLEMQGDEGLTRLENINELKSTMSSYEENADEPSLSGFLEEISLYTDVDNLDSDADYVVLMTMHSAKGLEFPIVFVVGMEDNIFPSSRSLESEADTEEERRLAYVAVTRAKEKLYLTHAEERMLYGRTDRNRISRFIKELPADCIEKQAEETKASPYLNGYEKPHSMSLQQQLVQRKADKSNFSVNTETFAPGDRVLHKIFGEGTVLSSKPMANDTLVEIAFDNRGTKKIMANYTKIKKI
ncbi:ATP-dependent helicase [Ruminococcus sp.]|uniref:ATP-dependent helicase n=1 Tax=Ruminococcus sp. TaxID=41978 RepID=UPI002E76F09E|nr:UvrD-helicase domain-containing protein [Ruminococcus sp.]MEE0501123.1 3'-5' exonuclease [Ruminococcus sp.]